MKFLSIVFCLFVSFGIQSTSFAHSDHHHARKKAGLETVNSNAMMHVERLIGKKKLVSSWSKAKLLSSEKKKFKKKTEWVVTFENPSASDPKKKVLYIFLSLYGDFIAANFSGK